MTYYRLYRFEEGHIREATGLDCEDDVAARYRAFSALDGAVLELWQGARLVERIDPQVLVPPTL